MAGNTGASAGRIDPGGGGAFGPLPLEQLPLYGGEAKRAHGEAEAERLLARGLAALELAEGQLAETKIR